MCGVVDKCKEAVDVVVVCRLPMCIVHEGGYRLVVYDELLWALVEGCGVQVQNAQAVDDLCRIDWRVLTGVDCDNCCAAYALCHLYFVWVFECLWSWVLG